VPIASHLKFLSNRRTRQTLMPWCLAALVCLLVALARTFLIQPPALAHGCEATLAWWCVLRLAIIYTYAFHTIGQVAIALVILAFFVRRVFIAAAALTVGLAALVLYCYEPGAVAAISGALLLARFQASRARTALPPFDERRPA
jgi:hypothetical protein